MEVKKEADELDRKFRQSASLEKQKILLENKIEKSRNELLSEHTFAQREITRLETLAKTLPELKTQLTQAQARSAKLTEAEATLKQKETAARESQTALNLLGAEAGRLEKEIVEAGDKLAMLAAHIASHTEAKCPLCETELTREGLELIGVKYRKEQADKSFLLEQSRAGLRQKKAELDALQKEKVHFETRLNEEKTKNHSQETLIRQKIKESEENASKAAEQQATASAIEERLASRTYAPAEQQALAVLETEIAGLGYNAPRHEEVRRLQKEFEPFERDKTALDEAARLIEQERTAATRAKEAAQGLQESLGKDTARKEALTGELAGLPQAAQELAGAEAEYKTISGQRSQAQQAVGSVTAKLQRLAEQENKKKEYEDRIAASAREESIYRELARAFGKNGIQALIIDAALPEIADEANRLLARLTDNRMTVKFETQRTTKKDTLKETLDIIIGDELGTRDYEMFSGGEAFRINFAIRIALSRLLARRAGAPLPTIIIDEGFGTQDAAGMEKLKEAINSIQNDFEKILVITHMDDLKDAFPARIDVQKTAGGSTITVN